MSEDLTSSKSESTYTMSANDLTGSTLSAKDLMGSTLSSNDLTGSSLSDGYLSFINDEQSREWNRKLFASDLTKPDLSGMGEAKELSFETDLPLTGTAAGAESEPQTSWFEEKPKKTSSRSYSRSYSSYSRPADREYSSSYGREYARPADRRKTGPENRRKSVSALLLIVFVIFIINIIIILVVSFLGYSRKQVIWSPLNTSHTTENGGAGSPDGPDETEPATDPDEQVRADAGSDYSDFYTPKYIVSVDPELNSNYGTGSPAKQKYQELCVIDNEAYLGTADSPVDLKRFLIADANPTWYSLGEINTDSFLITGYTVKYADSGPQYASFLPDLLEPPGTSDQDSYFQIITDTFKDPPEYFDDNYNGCQFSDIRETSVDGHSIAYMEVTYQDKAGNAILDVFSFERKPRGSAFVTEYRCPEGEVSGGSEALERLYGMLDFRTKDFYLVDASNCLFNSARVYNGSNTYAAKIDLSDLEDVTYSEMMYKNRVTFRMGEYGEQKNNTAIFDLEYRDYSTVDYYGGFEQWASEMIKDAAEDSGRAPEIESLAIQQFTLNRNDVYYITFNSTREYSGVDERVQFHKYRIETPEGGEILLDIEYVHDIPASYDAAAFLRRHLKIEQRGNGS